MSICFPHNLSVDDQTGLKADAARMWSFMNFIWSDFGVIDRWYIDSYGNFIVHNTLGDSRKMSSKYRSIFDQIEHKCQLLKGKFVQIRTSQNTAAWSPNDWFSDISLSGTEVNSTAPSMSSIEPPEDVQQKLENAEQERDDAKAETLAANLQLSEATRRECQSADREFIANQRADLATQRADLAEDQVEWFVEEMNHASLEAQENSLEWLISQGETLTCEFKESVSLDVRQTEKNKTYQPIKETKIEHSCLKTIVGFLNTNGGTLLVGVSDRKEVFGIDNEIEKLHRSLDKFLLYFKDLITNRLTASVFANVEVTTDKIGESTVLVVIVTQSEDPIFLKPGEEFYVRTPASTDKLEGSDRWRYQKGHFNK